MSVQSASGRSIGSSSQQEAHSSLLRTFDPPKTEFGVPEMSQLESPHQKTRKIYEILSPKPKMVTEVEGDEEVNDGEKEDTAEDFPDM